jgi:choline/glycine/proline betaine transport protein
MTIVSAFPFAIIMLLAVAGLWRALSIESLRDKSLLQHQANGSHPMRWRERIKRLVKYPSKAESDNFMEHAAWPSLSAVAQSLKEHGWLAEASFDQANGRVSLLVSKDNEVNFIYEVRQLEYPRPVFAREAVQDDPHYYRTEVFLRRGGQSYDVYGYEEQDLIADVLDQFEKYLHFMHISSDNLPWNTET